MRTALVIEDDEIAMKVFAAALDRCGFSVLRAWDGAAAVELCRDHAADLDLIVCDVMLPGKSGPAAMLEAAELGAEAPIVFTSGTPVEGWPARDLRFLERLQKHTRCISLLKPFRVSTLVEKIHAALGGADQYAGIISTPSMESRIAA